VEADCIIRGDLANVKVGRFSLIGKGTVIRPAAKLVQDKGEVAFLPLTIDEHVTIGKNCLINATVIGKFVQIGDNCVIVRLRLHSPCKGWHTAMPCTD
jgi:dynactin-5